MGEAGTRERVEELKKALKARLRDGDKARKALEELGKPGALEKLDVVGPALGALREADLAALGLGDPAGALVGALVDVRGQLEARARMKVLGELTRLAEAEGLSAQRVGDAPPAVLVAPLVVELDFDRGLAVLTYAREPVAEVPLDAAAILKARGEVMAAILEAAAPSEVFFERLVGAYRLALAAGGGQAGDRVDLVDLLAPLALLQTPREGWRKADLSKLEPFPRHLLAYQLQRMRREGVLERGGLRLELGTATGGTTRNKRDVLFVPTTPSEGQYYLSVRFTGA